MAVEGFTPGDVIADKYRVERIVAQGGMGLIVAARHTTLDKEVAIKCLVRPEGLLPEEAVNRFTREARAAASIDSDHVCRVFDVGVVGSTPYMVMEYLEGHDLEVELQTRGRIPIAEAVDFLLQALQGLNAAHALGIVHRDLKPANLFLAVRPDGTRRVKILDFGISKVEGRDAKLTDTQGSFGTPFYMSPEQIKNAKHADLRTDIWALGAILYELVTGEPPFGGETSGEVFAAVLEAVPVPMEARARETPPELAAIVMRCLSRDRDARYAGAGELSLALAPFGTGEVAPARAIVPRARGAESSRNIAAATVADSELLNTAAAAAWTTGHSRKVRRTRWAIAGGAAVLAALVIVGIAVGRAGARSGGTTTAAPPSAAPAIASTIPGIDPSAVAFTAVTSASAEPEASAASSAKARPPAPLKGAKVPVGSRTSPLQKTEPKKSASDILKDSY